MAEIEIVFNVAFVMALLAAICYALLFLTGKKLFRNLTAGALAACALAILGYLGWRGLLIGHFPLSNQFESLLVMLMLGLTLALFFFFRSGRKSELLLPGVIVAPVVFAFLALLDSSVRPLMPALRSNWLFFHVFSSMFSYAAFVVAGFWSLLLLLRGKVGEYESYLLKLARIGFAFLTVGIVTGSVWADRAWGRFWSWDPKETWSLITWVVYALAIHLYLRGWRKEKLAWMLIAGLLAVIFTYFGVNYLLGGLHSYA